MQEINRALTSHFWNLHLVPELFKLLVKRRISGTFKNFRRGVGTMSDTVVCYLTLQRSDSLLQQQAVVWLMNLLQCT